LVELLSALALLVGPTPPAPPSVAWGDTQHAWVGTGTAIYGTGDGGRTWRTESRAPGLTLSAVDGGHAWAISGQGQTVRTTGGTQWTILGVQHLLALSFVDARNGFALDRDGQLLRSRDGGASWKEPWGFRLQSLCFSDARTGWVARNGVVWTTLDGGTHWRSRALERTRQGFPIPSLYCHGSDVWVVEHSGAGAGTEGYRIFRSFDRGTTWRAVFATFVSKLPRVSNYSGPISALGGGDAVLEGSCGPCDGSGTVTFVHGTVRTTLSRVQPGPLAFANRRLGLAVLSGTIYRTIDGGRTWRRVFAPR
jgi:Photosynthesis system II assembly factor YCF48